MADARDRIPELIDPRLGDAEDDVSSPKSRPLLAVAGGLLTEISLPKLAVAVASLLVVPSVVVGVAPLLVTGWITTLSGQLRADAGLVPAVLLAAVAAVGWLGGRRLLKEAERSFWALNALAVQPGYALFREILRHLAEGLLSRGRQRRRLLQVRAGGAAFAGFLLSAIAFAVALWLWPFTDWIADPGELTKPQRLLWPVLANTGVVLNVFLAVAALVWGIADAAMPQPQSVREFAPGARSDAHWRIAHLSDLHVVGERFGYRIESGRAGPRGNERVAAALSRLADIHAENPLDLVLISGDMTDAGRSAEWAEFLELLHRYPTLRERTLMLPGNHDVNVVDRSNPARLDLPMSPTKRLRQLRALSAIVDVQGERVRLVDPATGRVGPSLAAFLEPHRPVIRSFADDGGTRRASRRLADLWDEVFPMVLPPTDDRGLGVLLLNSNAETHFSFTNALGLVTAAQTHRVRRVMESWPRANWIIALHHHLVEYPRPVSALSERIGTVLINGSWFVRQLRPFAPRVIAMHGHRHIDWIGMSGDLRVISAPSPVMTPGAPAFHIHHFAPTEGGLALLAPETVELAEVPMQP